MALTPILARIQTGELTLALPDGLERRFRGRSPGPSAYVQVLDPAVLRRVVFGGGIAFAQGYMDRSWDTPDLDAVLDLAAADLQARGPSRLPLALRPRHRLWHAMRDNHLTGARRNIEYHYDLGNDFYRLWLDPTMTYSSACFEEEGISSAADGPGRDAAGVPPGRPAAAGRLERAQRRKWDRILELIQPRRDDHLLEIGCGWGGFAMHAAEQAGCRVTGLTLSREQADLARRRVEERGLADRIRICERDYRQERGSYDGIASIEMFEAVGERWWPVYFGRVKELLRPGARAALQVITIGDEHFERYRRRPDFTQRYIFPGGMLPSPGRFAAVAQNAGLRVNEPRFFGHDYARTLRAWAARFENALPEVRGLGFDETFVRMWRYYLSYCRAGFAAGRIDVMQVGLEHRTSLEDES